MIPDDLKKAVLEKLEQDWSSTASREPTLLAQLVAEQLVSFAEI